MKVVDVLDFSAPIFIFVDFVDKKVLTAYFAKLVGGINEGMSGKVGGIGGAKQHMPVVGRIMLFDVLLHKGCLSHAFWPLDGDEPELFFYFKFKLQIYVYFTKYKIYLKVYFAKYASS